MKIKPWFNRNLLWPLFAEIRQTRLGFAFVICMAVNACSGRDSLPTYSISLGMTMDEFIAANKNTFPENETGRAPIIVSDGLSLSKPHNIRFIDTLSGQSIHIPDVGHGHGKATLVFDTMVIGKNNGRSIYGINVIVISAGEQQSFSEAYDYCDNILKQFANIGWEVDSTFETILDKHFGNTHTKEQAYQALLSGNLDEARGINVGEFKKGDNEMFCTLKDSSHNNYDKKSIFTHDPLSNTYFPYMIISSTSYGYDEENMSDISTSKSE